RRAILASLLHALSNVAFGLSSVAEAIAMDQPEGAELVEYVRHLRGPGERLEAIVKYMARCTESPPTPIGGTTPRAIVEAALDTVSPLRRPLQVEVLEEAPPVRGSVGPLARVLVAVLESDGTTRPESLRVETCRLGALSETRIFVERSA